MTRETPDRCALARSLLFAPGNRPALFDKAIRSGADAVILDLEDSVPIADKAMAREAVEREWERLLNLGVLLVVRINPADTDAGMQDLSWLKRMPPPAAVMLPKVESARSLAEVHDSLNGVLLLPLIESAAGYAALPSLAAAPGVIRLVVGNIDFMADVGLQCDESESELAPLRFAIAIASRLNHLAPAVDGVTVQIGEEQRLRNDTHRALRFGFGGKLCIHPRQVAVIHQALLPTEEELTWARRVIAADAQAAGAAVQLDGRMVDLPVVLQARRTLARATDAGTTF
ncbi:CoA ester lyase [Variovorax sp. J22R115]|uniref:HpcH/HpaI aldolase/citrate lyase family protein n=1 Tax=Variovorax sp. J22R115 TaxID=3053509 RepID=UPI0025791F0C|nr:CoA ester lyase [Variovorax sp. J22R115]MDM0047470.1 CoA ester lyase [Variovorax sp. J22R115]